MTRWISAGAVLVGALLSMEGAMAAASAGDEQVTVQVGALARTCVVHLPPAYDGRQSLPLVIALHGSRGSGKGMAAYTGLSALADEHGFIAAYPDGIVEPHSWNSLFGRVPGGTGVLGDDIDDVAFIRALIDSLHASRHTDPGRVFVCGFSSGAYMSYRAAVKLPDKIAAAGIVCGSLGTKSVDGKPVPVTIPIPAAPISLIHIGGGRDGAVKLGGAQTPKNLFKPAAACVEFFGRADGCVLPGKETRDAEHGVARTLYTGGRAGTEVELVIVDRSGHQWPTLKEGLSANEELWGFFARHGKG